MTDLSKYRPNVGLALFSEQGRVFVGRRLNSIGPHQWQMPQGGIDEGENVLDAAWRELEEEVGVPPKKAKVLEVLIDWLPYEFPPEVKKRLGGPYIGQKQRWCAFRFLGTDRDIRLDLHEPEFDAWRWARLNETPEMVVPFKRKVYLEMVQKFDRWTES